MEFVIDGNILVAIFLLFLTQVAGCLWNRRFVHELRVDTRRVR